MQLSRQYELSIFNNHLIFYPTALNINYFWGYGSLAGMFLTVQLVTGIFLAMHYTAHVDWAFFSIEHIMRDVNYGSLIRYMHANGASFFFLVVYVHIARGLYQGSYNKPRDHLWNSGVLIFIIMMATGFMGYVLPWGQMSFWGATVITNLFTAIPLVGETIAFWLWGGFSVDNPTLNRFFSLHYLLPFAIVGLVLVHLALLHKNGSSSPEINSSKSDKIPFYPYFYVKDLFGFLSILVLFSIFIFFYPNSLGDPDNYIQANPLVTPVHIVPEWYFLPFYAMLRSIPDKLGGVILMGLSLVVLFTLPYLTAIIPGNSQRANLVVNSRYRGLYKFFFYFFVGDVLFLGWIGSQPVENLYVTLGQLGSIYYFLFLLVILPLSSITVEGLYLWNTEEN